MNKERVPLPIFDECRSYLYMEVWSDQQIERADGGEEEIINRVTSLRAETIPEIFIEGSKLLIIPCSTRDKHDVLRQRGYYGFRYVPRDVAAEMGQRGVSSADETAARMERMYKLMTEIVQSVPYVFSLVI